MTYHDFQKDWRFLKNGEGLERQENTEIDTKVGYYNIKGPPARARTRGVCRYCHALSHFKLKSR